MSEGKLYAVTNDEGKYWDFEVPDGFWECLSDRPVTTSNEQAEQAADEQAEQAADEQAEQAADEHGGHVVTLTEEPAKVVLNKEQAEIVEEARTDLHPAYCISALSDEDEELLMRAYVNDYTVAKEKKYYVKVPHTDDFWYYKPDDGNLRTICPEDKKLRGTFIEEDIEKYGLQDCEKVECD